MDRTKFQELNDFLTGELEKNLPASMGKPDWLYRDFPRVTRGSWERFKFLLGEEMMLVTEVVSETHGRGQALISPKGCEIARLEPLRMDAEDSVKH